MLVQKWLVKKVLNCLNPHPDSYAYQLRRSIRACATRHLGARWLVKADLHDFFHSINERSVYRVFVSVGYSPLISLELARLCTRLSGRALVDSSTSRQDYPAIPNYHSTHLGFLPQGAPTSGALANLVARRLDERLSAYAVAHRLVYTRYADDLTFSSGGEFRRGHAAAILQKANLVTAECGFALHHRKSRIVPPGARKIVLGLLVDGDRIRIRKESRSRIITHVRGVEKFGLSAHRVKRGFSSSFSFILHVEGLLSFAQDVDGEWCAPIAFRWRAALNNGGWNFPELRELWRFEEPRVED
jgi:RNA-directed DNA polymerase